MGLLSIEEVGDDAVLFVHDHVHGGGLLVLPFGGLVEGGVPGTGVDSDFLGFLDLLGLSSLGVLVEDVVLKEEDDVVEDGEDRQGKLHYVECAVGDDGFPIAHCFDYQLEQREQPSRKVKDNIGDGPADSGLALVVQVHLGTVLDESDGGFDVATEVKDASASRQGVAGDV